MCSGTTSDIPISRLESLKKSVVAKFNKGHDKYGQDVGAANRNKSAQHRINLRKISECIYQEGSWRKRLLSIFNFTCLNCVAPKKDATPRKIDISLEDEDLEEKIVE